MEGDTVSQPTCLAERLYERYRQKMYATAFRMLRNADDAEDAVADAVVRQLLFAFPDGIQHALP